MRTVSRFSSPGALLLSIAILGFVIFRAFQSHPAQAQQVPAQQVQAQPVVPAAAPHAGASTTKGADISTYFHIQKLRSDLALTSNDLAALGCNQSTATSVLASLSTWYSANKTALQQAELAKNAALVNFRKVNRQIHMGPALGQPRDENLIASFTTLQQAATQAEQQRQQVLAGAASQVAQLFSGDQVSLWTNARNNLSAPAQLRYAPALSAQQIQTLKLAASQSGGMATALPAELSTNQLQALQLAAQNVAFYRAGVAAAEQSTLPSPLKFRRPMSPMGASFLPAPATP